MKTNVTMVSQDRNLFGVYVRQDTKTGFLNLTDLQSAYDVARVQNGWTDKRFNEVLGYGDNLERIYYVLESQKLINTSLPVFMEMVNKDGIIKVLKKLGVYKMTGARQSRAVACNPYIWVLIALELNPMLYAKVITWLTDKLILNRVEAGDMYRGLSSSIAKWNPDYATVAKSLNWVVFNKHEPGIRNKASEAELKELKEVEMKMSWAVDTGLIENYKDFISNLRKLWRQKNLKKI